MFLKHNMVVGFRDYKNSQVPLDCKLLRTFSPLMELNLKKHLVEVAATSITGKLIKDSTKQCFDRMRYEYVMVKLADWDAAL